MFMNISTPELQGRDRGCKNPSLCWGRMTAQGWPFRTGTLQWDRSDRVWRCCHCSPGFSWRVRRWPLSNCIDWYNATVYISSWSRSSKSSSPRLTQPPFPDLTPPSTATRITWIPTFHTRRHKSLIFWNPSKGVGPFPAFNFFFSSSRTRTLNPLGDHRRRVLS